MSTGTRDLIGLTAIALVIRIVVAILIGAPPWTDSAYYFAAGRELATGGGLTVPFVWSFLETDGSLPADPTLPIPAHAHWMPLTSFTAAAGMAVLGPHWWAAQVPMVLLSTAMTPVTYLVAMDLWRSRLAAVVGSLLVIFCGPLLLFGSIVENFAVFGLAGLGALYAAMRAARGDRRAGWWLVASGALVGLATLARIEGVLLSIATATSWFIGMGWSWWSWTSRRIGWLAGFASFAAFAVVVAPWAARNLATFGAVLPSTGGSTLWIKSYNEQFSITADTSIGAYLAQGPLPIVGSKLGSWLVIGGYVFILLGGVFAIPFAASLWTRRREARAAPFIVYFLAMLVFMGGLFTFHAPRGLFNHHASAWLPIAAPLAVAGMAPTVTFLSRWWRFLGRPATHRFLIVASFAAAVVISVTTSALLLRAWREDVDAARRVATFLDQHADSADVVMHRDAPLLSTISGYPVIGPPFDPFPVVERVARAYGADWYVVQRQSQGDRVEPSGLWEGGRAVDAQGNRATWLEEVPAYDQGGVRIYAIRE